MLNIENIGWTEAEIESFKTKRQIDEETYINYIDERRRKRQKHSDHGSVIYRNEMSNRNVMERAGAASSVHTPPAAPNSSAVTRQFVTSVSDDPPRM